jgi:hypothetical protein
MVLTVSGLKRPRKCLRASSASTFVGRFGPLVVSHYSRWEEPAARSKVKDDASQITIT